MADFTWAKKERGNIILKCPQRSTSHYQIREWQTEFEIHTKNFDSKDFIPLYTILLCKRDYAHIHVLVLQCHEDTPNRNKESKDKPVDVAILIIKSILESRSSIHHVSPSCVQHTLPKDLCMMQISKDLRRIHIYTIYRQNKIDTISTCLKKSVAIVTPNWDLPWACQCFHWCIEGIRCPLHLPTPLHTLLSIRAQHPAFN